MKPSPATDHRIIANKYFLIALGLVSVLAFTLLLCGVSFLCGLSLGKWQFPVGCLLALVVNYYAAKFVAANAGMILFVKTGSVVLASAIVSIIVAGFIYDVSFDGQWYHQETVYLLNQGYNPVYQQLAIPKDEALSNDILGWCSGVDKPIPHMYQTDRPPVNLKFINMNNFAKGTEIIEASIYKLTGHIETGKAVNCMLLIASLFLTLALLYKIDAIGVRKKWLQAVLIAFNPVSIIQLFTFCVDGFMGSVLLCILVTCCLLYMEVNRSYLLMLGLLLVLAINIKFTSLLFAAMFCVGFLIMLLIGRKLTTLKNVFATCAIATIIGIVIGGFNPYVTNLMQKHDVFYGLEDTRIEIKRLTPPILVDLNRFEKLFFSLSAHQGWHTADKQTLKDIPKIPFTFNKEDIHNASDAEQELSGFGPFFSGALVIALIAFIAALRYWRSVYFKWFVAMFLLIGATIVVMPDSWWARFVPQFWLLPILIMCFTGLISYRGKRLINGALFVSLGLNVAWALLSVVFNLFATTSINYQMQQLKATNKPTMIEYCRYRTFKSNYIRFQECGVPIVEEDVTGRYVYNIIGSNTRVATAIKLPDLPKPFLLKLSEKINGKK